MVMSNNVGLKKCLKLQSSRFEWENKDNIYIPRNVPRKVRIS